jgi:hypothetical protein
MALQGIISLFTALLLGGCMQAGIQALVAEIEAGGGAAGGNA